MLCECGRASHHQGILIQGGPPAMPGKLPLVVRSAHRLSNLKELRPDSAGPSEMRILYSYEACLKRQGNR